MEGNTEFGTVEDEEAENHKDVVYGLAEELSEFFRREQAGPGQAIPAMCILIGAALGICCQSPEELEDGIEHAHDLMGRRARSIAKSLRH